MSKTVESKGRTDKLQEPMCRQAGAQEIIVFINKKTDLVVEGDERDGEQNQTERKKAFDLPMMICGPPSWYAKKLNQRRPLRVSA